MKPITFLLLFAASFSARSQDSAVYIDHSKIARDAWIFVSENRMQSGRVIRSVKWHDGRYFTGEGVFANYPDHVNVDSMVFRGKLYLEPGHSADSVWTTNDNLPMIFYKSADREAITQEKRHLYRKRRFNHLAVYKRESAWSL